MNDNRGRDGKNEHITHERNKRQQNRQDSPKEFEGMNFEQQRGSYKNSDGGGNPDRDANRKDERRQEENY